MTSHRIRSGFLRPLPELRLPRVAWAGVSLAIITAVVYLAREYGAGWVALGFALMPDIGLLAGMSRDMAKGQLHPRAVPLYNALHIFIGPAAMLLLAVTQLIGDWGWVAGLAWAAHIAVDRAVGYGLRTREGFQRG